MTPFLGYVLGIGAFAVLLGLIAVYDLDDHGRHVFDRLVGRRPLTREEALSGPSRRPQRRRQWGVHPRGVRDWASDAELHEVA